jgi:hypothetical protein
MRTSQELPATVTAATVKIQGPRVIPQVQIGLELVHPAGARRVRSPLD